jgi:plasmid stabilization system protein ParE
MRWLSLLIVSIGIVLSGTAFALPQPDAEAAYARGDYATAFKIWLPLAEQGSVQAQLNVARMYERGEWVAQDKQAAMEWYNKAAAQNARDGTMPTMPNVASASLGPCRRRIRGRYIIPRRRLLSSFPAPVRSLCRSSVSIATVTDLVDSRARC